MKSIRVKKLEDGFEIIEEQKEKTSEGYAIFTTSVVKTASKALEEMGEYFQKEIAEDLRREKEKHSESVEQSPIAD